MTGIATAAATPAHLVERDRPHRGPGEAAAAGAEPGPPRRRVERARLQRVDQRDRVGPALLGGRPRPPPGRRRSGSASRSAASAVSGRSASQQRAASRPAARRRSGPECTFGQETLSSIAATSSRPPTRLDQRRELLAARSPSPRRSAAPAARASSGRSCSRKPSSPLFGSPIELIIPAGGLPEPRRRVAGPRLRRDRLRDEGARTGTARAARRRRRAGRRSRRRSPSR